MLVGLVLAVVLPVLAVTLSRAPYAPDGDWATFEMGLRRLAEGHPPSVGVFSRFGWYHPGPALYYLMGGPYLLAGGAGIAMPVTAVLANGGCLAGVGLLVRRHRGLVAALWSLLVCLLYLRQLPHGFLVDVWNPYLPMLPFLVAVLLCWAFLLGDRWALPVALVVLSFCVQAHVGYAAAAAALLAGTAVARALMRSRRPDRPSALRVWVGAGVVLALLWLPPIWQQLTGHQGNLGALITDLRTAQDGPDVNTAVWLVGTEMGRLPAVVTGTTPQATFVLPSRLPMWMAVVALVVFTVACGYAIRRRDWPVVKLGGLTAAVGLAAALAVTRVRGVLFSYLVQWATVAGILLWITVGTAAAGAMAGRAGASRASRASRAAPTASRWVHVALCLAVVPALALVVAANTGRLPHDDPEPVRLADNVVRWLPSSHDVVTVRYAPSPRPTLLGVTGSGAGFILALDKRGVQVEPPPNQDLGFGPVKPRVSGTRNWTVLLDFADDHPPPPAGFREVAHAGQLIAYAAPAGCC